MRSGPSTAWRALLFGAALLPVITLSAPGRWAYYSGLGTYPEAPFG